MENLTIEFYFHNTHGTTVRACVWYILRLPVSPKKTLVCSKLNLDF